MKSFIANLQTIALLTFALLLTACSDRSDGPSEIVNARPISPYYIVKPGDTFAGIASQNSMTESELASLNNINESRKIFTGQRILVRVSSASTNTEYAKKGGDIVVKELDAEVPLGSSDPTLSTAPTSVLNTDALKNDTLQKTLPTLNEEGLPAPEMPSKRSFREELSKEPIQQMASSSGFEWPVKGKVLINFGQKMPDGTISDSIQISAPVDTKVKAAASGKVASVGEVGNFGKIIVVKHNDGKSSVYTYLKEISVKKGQEISQGQVIGRVGKNGSKPMLLLQVRKVVNKKSIPIDPLPLLG